MIIECSDASEFNNICKANLINKAYGDMVINSVKHFLNYIIDFKMNIKFNIGLKTLLQQICQNQYFMYEPRSDKRDLLAIKVKSEIITEKERPSCCEQLQKI